MCLTDFNRMKLLVWGHHRENIIYNGFGRNESEQLMIGKKE